MKYSELFGRTSKNEGTDLTIDSHRLLTQAGYIRESTAGRYFMLPLGQIVHDKTQALIKRHMDAAGAQQMVTPTLHPLELWKETNRTDSAGFELMTVEDRRGADFALGGTAEEMIVDVVRKFNLSYRDLPFNIYQFSLKFRDEMRARGGLLRVREFVMKDAYSFSTQEQFEAIYKQMSDAYSAIFTELGLEFDIVEADNGYIGGEYCHEFVALSDIGESRYFIDEQNGYVAHEDVAVFEHEVVNPDEQQAEFKIDSQPQWVKTMEDNVKHYGKDARHFLKNVVYRVATTGDLVIVTIRGDLEVNKTKVEQLLKLVGQLEDAADEDLAHIGTKTGYVHAWGHEFVKPVKTIDETRDRKIIYVADDSLKTVTNFIGGQKEDETDSFNVNYGRDFTHEVEGDVAIAQAGFKSKQGGTLEEKKGIEVGNIFQLGRHYTNIMKGSDFTAESGDRTPYYMGCYGIGVGRTIAAVVEQHHDENGIVWPEVIAPYTVVIVTLAKSEDEESFSVSQSLYEQLKQAGVDVLWDERLDVRPGEKFADADLVGVPHRLVVSSRSLENGGVEYKRRSESDNVVISAQEALQKFS